MLSFSRSFQLLSTGILLTLVCIPFRTGYRSMRDTSRKIFGDKTIDRTCEVYGLDEEGELRGSYRPTGHPGVSQAIRGADGK